ncbi:MAG: transcriptional repressor [Phycisphaeraceae bacterium]|nr:transcriptional repressor [Phycisphaeraceae bacterium]
MPMTDDHIHDLFRRHGLRATRQRERIYAALHASSSHPSADELLAAVRESDPGLSLATVYNTLDVLWEAGLCRRLNPVGGGPSRYDADLSNHAHVAMPDGRFMDLPEDLSRRLADRLGADLVAEVEHRMGIRVESVNLHLIARMPEQP